MDSYLICDTQLKSSTRTGKYIEKLPDHNACILLYIKQQPQQAPTPKSKEFKEFKESKGAAELAQQSQELFQSFMHVEEHKINEVRRLWTQRSAIRHLARDQVENEVERCIETLQPNKLIHRIVIDHAIESVMVMRELTHSLYVPDYDFRNEEVVQKVKNALEKGHSVVTVIHHPKVGGGHYTCLFFVKQTDGQLSATHFDSLSNSNGNIVTTVEHVFACLKPSNYEKCKINFFNTNHQTSGVDCGLYVFWYALLKAAGHSDDEVSHATLLPNWLNSKGREAAREMLLQIQGSLKRIDLNRFTYVTPSYGESTRITVTMTP